MQVNSISDWLHYLNDYFTTDFPDSQKCQDNVEIMVKTCTGLGLVVNLKKVTAPATITNILGIDIDHLPAGMHWPGAPGTHHHQALRGGVHAFNHQVGHTLF